MCIIANLGNKKKQCKKIKISHNPIASKYLFKMLT